MTQFLEFVVVLVFQMFLFGSAVGVTRCYCWCVSSFYFCSVSIFSYNFRCIWCSCEVFYFGLNVITPVVGSIVYVPTSFPSFIAGIVVTSLPLGSTSLTVVLSIGATRHLVEH